MIMRLSSDDNPCTRSASLATFHQDEKQTVCFRFGLLAHLVLG